MKLKPKRFLFLGLFAILFVCFGVTWFMQLWSILTLTTVGMIGTLTGWISFCPSLLLLNAIAIIVAYKEKSGQARLPFLLLVLVANSILIFSGTATIISTITSLDKHISYFTPRPEDITWDEWLELFLTFVLPEILVVVLAIVALTRVKGHSQQVGPVQRTENELPPRL